MGSRFDIPTEHAGVATVKWDLARRRYGCSELIPMWVADMDFAPPEAVREAVAARAQIPFYGYEEPLGTFVSTFCRWVEERHDWQIKEEWVAHSHGVVAGLAAAVQAFTKPGDQVVIQPPVYHPFFSVIQQNERVIVENELVVEDGKYRIDFAGLERAFAAGAKALIFCSPHNPVGRVWDRAELEELAALVNRYDVLVLCDEIWCDLTLPGHQHHPLAAVDGETAQRCVTFMAPSKTFNVAGFHLSNVIIPNRELREAYTQFLERLALGVTNSFAVRGAEAAYQYGAEWLEELRQYLKDNVEFALKELRQRVPEIKVIPPEGTYLMWLDCRALGLSAEELNSFFAQKAGVALNDGRLFGKCGSGFQRMNIACPRETLARALEQIEQALKS